MPRIISGRTFERNGTKMEERIVQRDDGEVVVTWSRFPMDEDIVDGRFNPKFTVVAEIVSGGNDYTAASWEEARAEMEQKLKEDDQLDEATRRGARGLEIPEGE